MYKYTPLLQSSQLVKQVISSAGLNQQIFDHVEPYLEVGHTDSESDKKTIELMRRSKFTGFFLDYPYFRQEPIDKEDQTWNIQPESNIFDFISMNLKPSEISISELR